MSAEASITSLVESIAVLMESGMVVKASICWQQEIHKMLLVRMLNVVVDMCFCFIAIVNVTFVSGKETTLLCHLLKKLLLKMI